MSLAIFLIALVVRVLHVRLSARLLLADDAVFFEQHAQAFVAAWRHLGSAEFGQLLKQAVDDASLQGIVYPLMLSAVYLAAGGVDHGAAALLQAVLGAAMVWLTFLTARRAFGTAAGVTAGLLAALYPPLVLTAGLLLAEGVLALLQSLGCYLLVRGLDPQARTSRLLGGVAVGVLMLRPAFQYVGVLCLVGLALGWVVTWRRGGDVGGSARARGSQLVGYCAPYVVGLLIVAGPWLTVNGVVYGKAVWSRTGDAWQQVYWGIYPPNRGWWPPDSPVPPKYGVESLPNAWAAGRQIQPRDLDYLEAAVNQVRATPLQAMATEVNKLYQGFLSPFNTYAEQPPLVAPLATPLHRLLALLGLGGLALWWRRPAPALVVALLTLGVSLPFLVSHIDVRYTVPAALSATLFAGHAVAELVRRTRYMGRARAYLAPVLAVCGVCAAVAIGVPVLLAALPSLAPLAAHRIHSAAVCGALVTAGWLVGDWLGEAQDGTRAGGGGGVARDWRLSGVFTGAVLALVAGIQALYSGQWHEWSATLRPGEAARQRIVLPAGWTPPPDARAEVRFYAQGARAQTYVPVVSVNGRVVAELGPAFAHGGPLRFEERIMVTASQQGKARADVPQWYGVPLEMEALSGGAVEIEVSLRPEPAGAGREPTWARIWGDYPSPAPDNRREQAVQVGRRMYEGPAFHSRIHGADDSFHKFVATGHSRLWRRVVLDSREATAALVRSGTAQDGDLSDADGRQTGEFRIRVLVFGPTGDLLAAF